MQLFKHFFSNSYYNGVKYLTLLFACFDISALTIEIASGEELVLEEKRELLIGTMEEGMHRADRELTFFAQIINEKFRVYAANTQELKTFNRDLCNDDQTSFGSLLKEIKRRGGFEITCRFGTSQDGPEWDILDPEYKQTFHNLESDGIIRLVKYSAS